MDALGIDFHLILVQIVGFLLLVFILAKFAFGPMVAMLQQRQDTIQGNMDEAASRRDEMVRLQREYEQRLAQIEDQARDKIQAAVREAQAARDEIVARAQAERESIVQRGYSEVASERDKAMVEVRNQIADLAVQAAGQVIRQHLNRETHAQLIDQVIAGIGANGSRGGAA